MDFELRLYRKEEESSSVAPAELIQGRWRINDEIPLWSAAEQVSLSTAELFIFGGWWRASRAHHFTTPSLPSSSPLHLGGKINSYCWQSCSYTFVFSSSAIRQPHMQTVWLDMNTQSLLHTHAKSDTYKTTVLITPRLCCALTRPCYCTLARHLFQGGCNHVTLSVTSLSVLNSFYTLSVSKGLFS